MKTYADVVDDVIRIYENNPRSFIVQGDKTKCVYENGGIGCAFKACCLPEIDLSRFDENNSICILILHTLGFDILKPEYRHLKNAQFWRAIQELHDAHMYWDGNKLTENGQSFANFIKAENWQLGELNENL